MTLCSLVDLSQGFGSTCFLPSSTRLDGVSSQMTLRTATSFFSPFYPIESDRVTGYSSQWGRPLISISRQLIFKSLFAFPSSISWRQQHRAHNLHAGHAASRNNNRLQTKLLIMNSCNAPTTTVLLEVGKDAPDNTASHTKRKKSSQSSP